MKSPCSLVCEQYPLVFNPHMRVYISVLTCDADMCLAAFGGSSGAPGHALAPVIFRTEQLLHLLSCNFYTGFSYDQTCRRKEKHRRIRFRFKLKKTVSDGK